MYTVDYLDTVEPEEKAPRCDPGAPMPIVVANDSDLGLAYYIRQVIDDKNPENHLHEEHVAVIRFWQVCSFTFGMPNDEALSGHPLWDRGLIPYGAHRVQNSSWIRKLEEMNRVHPHHRLELYSRYRHYIFTFHDTTFECIAKSFEVQTIHGMKLAIERLNTFISR